MVSLIIPAHNEGKVLGRLLDQLLADAAPNEFEILVVANGCDDDTEAVAEKFAPAVTLVSTPVPSKYRALRLGDEHATAFPRFYVDADVELDGSSVRALAAALRRPGCHAAAPARVIPLTGCPFVVRWYYDIWQMLPSVREGLYGRGVIAVDEEGYRRLSGIPDVMGDDLVASVAFSPQEREVVTAATVVVHPPRTIADLLRRRVRSVTGTAQLEARDAPTVASARTSVGSLVAVAKRRPWLAPKLAVFLAVTAAARARARRAISSNDYTTWLRDESSRAA